ncbi:MAG: hypothetical protein GY804_15080 [Alphaproteobacteria bacterium]|nr:hypothetical protein [Alphaproteobacteria bacterium]
MSQKLDKSQLKVGATVAPEGFPEGVIDSEDPCSLESFIDDSPKKHWLCWRVRTKAPRPLHKYLITDFGEDGIVAWKKSTLKFAPEGAKLWLERSGLEEMENIDSDYPESYIYSMLTYILDPEEETPRKFYGIERLRNDRIFRYEGTRID